MAILTAGRVLAGCSIGALPPSVPYKDIWAGWHGCFFMPDALPVSVL